MARGKVEKLLSGRTGVGGPRFTSREGDVAGEFALSPEKWELTCS